MAKSKKSNNKKRKKSGASANRPAQTQAAAKKGNGLSLGAKVVIAVLAVFMALSMMLPSLASIFARDDASAQQESSSDSTGSDAAAVDTAEAAAATQTMVQQVDAAYSQEIASLEAKLADDPTNLATLLNLGENYLTWGSYVSAYATTEEEQAHGKELLDQSVAYFDQYLELNESSAVRVDRAVAMYYNGDSDAAIAALEETIEIDPTYASAYANLGMLYEAAGRTDEATEAYNKAIELDPDDEYGARSFAEQALSGSEGDSGLTSDGQTLSEALSSGSGAGF